jgi:GNAT superfamily N-acetyltransferase
MIYQLESLYNVKEEIKPLLEKHWEEIALNKDAIKLNPDWEAYAKMDAAGQVRIFTARDNGELVGYFVVFVSTSLHYKDHKFANNDIIFLKKEYRKGLLGAKLIKFAVSHLKDENVSLLNINTKVHQPFDGLMERLGFNLIERVYSIKF